MAVQVNTFLICSKSEPFPGEGTLLRNFFAAPQCLFYPLNGQFPIHHTYNGFIQLRRDNLNGLLQFNGIIKCVDEDMNNLFEPVSLTGIFENQKRFFSIDFGLKMVIPKPGYYEIHWKLSAGGMETDYTYGLEVTAER